MRVLATFIAVIVLVPVGYGDQTVPTPALGTWSEKARLGEQRTEAAVVFANHRIYVLGGMARGQDSHVLNQEYDPATDRWRERAPMPRPLSHPGAAVMGGKTVVGGGFLRNVHLDAQDSVFEYDPAADMWRTLAPLKSPRGSVGVAAVNGKIHAIGGRFNTPNENTDMHDVFDPAANRWKVAAPLPTPRSGVSAVVYRASSSLTAASATTASRLSTTKPSTSKPAAGRTWRRCRPAVTGSRPQPTGKSSTSRSVRPHAPRRHPIRCGSFDYREPVSEVRARCKITIMQGGPFTAAQRGMSGGPFRAA